MCMTNANFHQFNTQFKSTIIIERKFTSNKMTCNLSTNFVICNVRDNSARIGCVFYTWRDPYSATHLLRFIQITARNSSASNIVPCFLPLSSLQLILTREILLAFSRLRFIPKSNVCTLWTKHSHPQIQNHIDLLSHLLHPSNHIQIRYDIHYNTHKAKFITLQQWMEIPLEHESACMLYDDINLWSNFSSSMSKAIIQHSIIFLWQSKPFV